MLFPQAAASYHHFHGPPCLQRNPKGMIPSYSTVRWARNKGLTEATAGLWLRASTLFLMANKLPYHSQKYLSSLEREDKIEKWLGWERRWVMCKWPHTFYHPSPQHLLWLHLSLFKKSTSYMLGVMLLRNAFLITPAYMNTFHYTSVTNVHKH